ncbi:GNAT family N-acetyltransferase [Sphingobium yanoikuyae]|uniref:GNAT family N-acetyltransferase n=1 Tax=Sphingobium yanoikuyae TaxID=13690 RepID=UPI0028A0CCDC|nr:GNAT family N-acetyltransferase [Sphingobium yanoikuyae]
MAGIIIAKLEAASQDQVSRFRMDHEDDKPLEIFIRSNAFNSAKANLTQTYVAKREGDKKVIGYVSIMCAEVALEKAYQIDDKIGADRYEYQPAVRISRLARMASCRGEEIGRQLVETAIGIVLISIVPHAGCRFIILDAKRKSIDFYKSLGFRLLDTQANLDKQTPLMFMDLRDLIDANAA